jgi:hypothetical protein
MIKTFLNVMKLKDYTPIVSADMVDWLIDVGFFEKPASINHHGNYDGGLFEHSQAVMTSLNVMTDKFGLKWEHERSPYIVGMFHDLCKVDDYIEVDGVWKHNDNKILTGHSDKSIIMLSQFMKLTEEEIFCIKFHMGAYDTDSWNAYDKAIRKYENVLWTHTADMYASKVIDV